MKTKMQFVGLLLLLAGGLRGQSPDSIESKIIGWMAKGDTTIFAISKEANNYLDTTQSATKDSFAKKYSRWYNFWHSRVDSFGRIDNASTYMLNYLASSPNSCNNGGQWSSLGPTRLNVQKLGIVNSLYVPSANSNTIFAGSNTGGLWRTQNANSTTPDWECITDNGKFPSMGIQSIAVDAVDANTMYIATGYTTHTFNTYGAGLLKTTNANAPANQVVWQTTGLTWGLNSWRGIIYRVVTHPTTSGFVLAGTADRIYKSTDGGTTFRTVLVGTATSQFHDFEFLPSNPSVIFASTLNKVYYSTDAGETWQDITPTVGCVFNSAPIHIDVVNSDPNSVYAHFRCGNDETPLYKNTYLNGTLQGWVLPHANASDINTHMGSFDGINGLQSEFSMSPNNSNIAYVAAHWFYKRNFTLINSGNVSTGHMDTRDLLVLDGGNGNDVLYVGNDGGISKSVDNGVTWVNLNGNGPKTTQFWDMGVSSERKDFIIAGAQDNSQFTYDGTNWQNHGGGDGFQSLVSWGNPNLVYTSSNGSMLKSIGGGSFVSAGYGITSDPFRNFIFRQDPNDENKYYYAKNREFEKLTASANGTLSVAVGGTIIDIGRGGTTNRLLLNTCGGLDWRVIEVQVAPSNSNIIYAAIEWADVHITCTQNQRLWRSDDGGLTWRAFGNFYWNITAISVNPENPNEIWVGFSGFGNSPSNPAVSGRVLHCANTDDITNPTFTDISNGLPMFPIQSLIYQKGGNGTLYCGNDVGVYRYDPALQQWLCFSSGLPSIIVADLEINYCEKMLYCSAYGRGIWRTPLHDIGAWVIDTNTTIATGTKTHVANDIIIKAPYTLTVNGTLNMSKDRKIIVEPGAKLYVNGGTITNLCGDTWQGIEVWGRYRSGQDAIGQGFLEINNGTVEYAKEAVRLWKPGDTTTTGGIVQANNATFRNNWRSVEFMKYQNGVLNGGGLLIRKPNVSFFTNCTFSIDNDYRPFVSQVPFRGHISMWHVDGVQIKGCTFENISTNNQIFTKAEDYGYGIGTIDANFNLQRYCTGNVYPCTSWAENSFYKLFEGVKISNIATLRTPAIDYAHFEDNHYGIYNSGVNNLSVTRSNFMIGNFPKARIGTSNIHEGFVNYGGNGFILEENAFSYSGTNSTGAILVGSRIADTRVNDNRIYRNSYSNLFVPNLANGINGGLGGTFFPEPGLKYLCNGKNAGVLDIVVAVNPGQSHASIGELQYELDFATGVAISAANTFTNNAAMNIWNGGLPVNPHVQYRFWPNNTPEIPGSVQNVTAVAADAENLCLSNFGTGSTTVADPVLRAAWTGIFYTDAALLDNAKNDWTTLLDGNNHAEWMGKVENADQNNAEQVKDELLGLAPWASETLLKAMLDNSVFSAGQILSVLQVHPDVLRKASFFAYIETGTNNLNYDQKESLKAYIDQVTDRTDQEALISSLGNEKTFAANMVIRDMLNDTIDPAFDSLKAWYLNIGTISADYAITDAYWQYNDISGATAWLDDMPNRHTFSTEEQAVYDDYVAFKTVLRNVIGDNRSFLELTSGELSTVAAIAEAGNALVHIQAQNLLNFAYEGNYRKEAYLPEEIQARPMQEPEKATVSEIAKDWIIKSVPNPSDAQTLLSYKVDIAEGEAILYVNDINGRKYFSAVLQKPTGELMINTSEWPAGIYVCTIQNGKQKSKPYKLTVRK